MGQKRPTSTDNDGDESVLSPRYQDAGLLVAQRSTDKSSRLESDAAHNLYVNVAAGALTPSGMQDVNILSSVPLTVSGPLTDVQLRTTPVPVSGTFFQVTQPVSGTVAVSNFPATQPVTGTFFQATQPVSGTLAVSNFPSSQAVTGPLTDVQLRTTPVPISGTVATGGLTDVQLRTTPVPVSGTFFQATQPISGTLAVSNFPASQAVTGPLTDVQLRLTAVPVSGAFFQATQPVSAASLPLPTGAATETTLGTRLADTTFTGRINTQGQKAMTASTPVVLASDQSAIPVTQTATVGTLANGAETAVAGSAVQVAASNASRKILIVQNTGVANVRVGITGVTATTGLRLTPGSMFIFEMPYCPQAAIFSIREGATSSTVLAQEIA